MGVPEGVPEGRCGFTLEQGDVPASDPPSAIDGSRKEWWERLGITCCWRETVEDADLCLLHVETKKKPLSYVSDTDDAVVEPYDGATFPESERDGRIDLAERRFAGSQFTGSNLQHADLSGGNLWWADLSEANLRLVNLSGADLHRATLTGANLTGGRLSNANLYRADLSGGRLDEADLSGATLIHAKLDTARLVNADLTDASLNYAELTNTNLNNSNLSSASLIRATLSNARLHGTNLRNTNLLRADLTRSHLRKAFLANADFREARLSGTDLTDARLPNAILSDADLTDANLNGADLSGVVFDGAVVTDANFRGTILNRAHLEGVELDGIDFRNASLVGVKIYNAVLQNVRINDDTELGDYCIYEREAAGSPEEAASNLEKAIWTYRTYQRLLRENGLSDDIPKYYVREMHARRKLARAKNERLEWVKLALARWTMLYGESPKHVVGTSGAIIAIWTVLYLLTGGIEETVNSPNSITHDITLSFGPLVDSPPELATTIFANLYFSVVTFTTLGYGDVQPASGAVQLLAGVESLLGAALIALLVAVLSRRVMR